ncbi:MAG: isoprenylcysteine carboxylmethyltransferase family protein [Candidatus Bathyarchaeota archaeon]|nr:isoprenylcysteine carboxylmethyltransferase family protein [Candidatus Bathyarchaeota archaeon]
MKERDDGKVRDIEDRLQKGEINHKEAYKILIERGFTESGASIARAGLLVLFIALWIAFFALWLLPPISKSLNLDVLAFFSGLQSFTIPLVVIYVSIFIFALGTVLFIWANLTHKARGGINRADETIIFHREGLYKFVRHPQNLGGGTWFIFLPVILSQYTHFTILTVFAIASMIVYIYIASHLEEKNNIEKWGDEYRQYLREVPRFNILLGVWRHIRRKKSK